MAEEVWMDSKALGKVPVAQARRAEVGAQAIAKVTKAHAWVWSGRCRLRGTVSLGGRNKSKCRVFADRSKVNVRHLVRAGR